MQVYKIEECCEPNKFKAKFEKTHKDIYHTGLLPIDGKEDTTTNELKQRNVS